jgi:SAM-dependent methyltransferase
MTKHDLSLMDVIRRRAVPIPWAEGEKIPWNEPDFSARMLKEHLSQAHDKASRRIELIDRHVEWIHHTLLGGKPLHVLDLGCGPGLYASRLGRLGHQVVGIDFSPASIDYARQQAQADGLPVTYIQQDVRQADFGTGFGLVMFIFGELNAFKPQDAQLILQKARQALAPGGQLLLEVSTFEGVKQIGEQPPGWYSAESGLWSEHPYLCLSEKFWNAEQAAATERIYIIDGETGVVTPCAETYQAYTTEQFQSLLEKCSFSGTTFYPSLGGVRVYGQEELMAITAETV